MTKVKAGPIQADRLKSFIERVEKLEEERNAIGGDLRDVYSEAKGAGYDVKTMRKVVALRKIDAADRDEQEALLDTYKHALGMGVALVDSGLSLRRAAKAAGVSKSSLHRALAVPKASQPAGVPDAADAVITETQDASPLQLAPGLATGIAAVPSTQPVPEGGVGTGTLEWAEEAVKTIDWDAPRRPLGEFIGEVRDKMANEEGIRTPETRESLVPNEGTAINRSATSGTPCKLDEHSIEGPAAPSVGAVAEPQAQRVAQDQKIDLKPKSRPPMSDAEAVTRMEESHARFQRLVRA